MRLVDDEDAVARLAWRENGRFAQLTHIVDGTVGGGVELRHIQVAVATRRERAAGLALTTRGGGGAVFTVQRPGEDAGRTRLAAATRAGEEVGVTDVAAVERDGQRPRYMLLTSDFCERCRTILVI